jgi:parallel beta-helix repeat protein
MGVTVRGIQFNGNGTAQTENNCDGIRLIGVWNVNIENCGFSDHRGHLMFVREVNGVNVTACNFYGNDLRFTKGIFNYSCADFKLVDCEGGGSIGPVLWVSGPYAWQCFYHQNFLFNAVVRRYQVSSFSGQEITTSTDHVYSNGSPIEFLKGAGSTLPYMSAPPFIRGGLLTIGLKYVITSRTSSDFTTVGAAANTVGTIFTASGTGSGLLDDNNTVKNMQQLAETRSYWAVKTAAGKLKVCYNYFDAVAGIDSEYFDGGSGTYYIHHGMASGIYVTGGHDLSILGNRTEQNMEHGIALNGAKGNSITGNIPNTNQHDTEHGIPATDPAAGVYLKNGSSDNVILGNVFSDQTPTYPQAYGVWIDSSNGRNYLGQNSYRANASMVPTLINATGNTTLEQPVVQTATSTLVNSPTTIHTPNITSALTLTRDDTSKSWDFQVSADILRIRNVTAGYTGLDIQSSSSAMSLILGLGGSVAAPRGTFIYGEIPNGSVGTDVAGANITFTSSPGTGSSTTGGDIVFGTPNAGASGGTVQSGTSKFIIKREGQVQFFSRSSAPTVGVVDGQVYYDTTLVGLYSRHASNWTRLCEPNNAGISKITVDSSATFTFTALSSKRDQILTAPITANRTVTLSSTGAVDGARARFTRTAASTGAFNWDIGGLKNLTVGTWCEVAWDGSAWVLLQFGSL